MNATLTGISVLLALILGIVAGHNTGIVEGQRMAASACHGHGSFKYGGNEYRCRSVYTMTAKEWAAKRESMK